MAVPASYLVDDLPPELVLRLQHLAPQLAVHALHNVARLQRGTACTAWHASITHADAGIGRPHWSPARSAQDSKPHAPLPAPNNCDGGVYTLPAASQAPKQPAIFLPLGPPHLELEHGMLVGAGHQRVVALAALVGHTGQRGVALQQRARGAGMSAQIDVTHWISRMSYKKGAKNQDHMLPPALAQHCILLHAPCTALCPWDPPPGRTFSANLPTTSES